MSNPYNPNAWDRWPCATENVEPVHWKDALDRLCRTYGIEVELRWRSPPAKNEVEALVELLDAAEYETPQALAKALLKRTAELFAEREWYQVVMRPDPHLLFTIGPFPTEGDAKRALKADRIFGQVEIHRLLSVTKALSPAVTEGNKGMCTCGHLEVAHHTTNTSCCVRGCECRRFATE